MPTKNKYPICVAAAALAATHAIFPLILDLKTIQFAWISNSLVVCHVTRWTNDGKNNEK